MTAPDLTAAIPRAVDLGRVHFIGIGGAGMSGIARIMLARGIPVSGSDARETATTTALAALGADVVTGHAAANIGAADTVVYSTAIRDTNPELVAARAAGRRLLPRAAALAAVMQDRRAIAVAGTHGKTTTTSMVTVALQHSGVDPSFAIGGNLSETGANAHDGASDIFVAEADESDGSFVLLPADIAIVTNVEADHLDHYGTPAAVEESFADFAARIRPDGVLIGCADDPGARRLAARVRAAGTRVLTYGTAADADIRLTDVRTAGGAVRATLTERTAPDIQRILALRLPGVHNALDAAAAYTAAVEAGADRDRVLGGLAAFTGTRRRFEPKGVAGGVWVYDDYAHHPTELAAVLTAARDVLPSGGRLIACFQPHLYSRTRLFAAEFGTALALADEVVVMDVYAAREDPEPGVTGALVAAAVPLPGHVTYEPSWTATPALLARLARPGDLVITFGAGDVTLLGPEVLALLDEHAATTESEVS